MLNFVLGRAGYGKTEYIRNKATEYAKNGESVVVIVPEQMSFDTEKAMAVSGDMEINSKIEIFSFNRLCEETFRLYGGIKEKRIDDSAKELIMALAIDAVRDNLDLYKNTESTALCTLMLDAVEEFKNSGITTEEVMSLKDEFDGALSKKLYESALIYESFKAHLSGSYIEPLDIQTRAGDLLLENKYFKDKILLIDGFEGFDARKLKIIESAFSHAKEVYISLCEDDDFENDESHFFAPITKTRRKLMRKAREKNVKIAPHVRLESAIRFESDELKILEKSVYSYEETEEVIKREDVSLFEAANIYDEAEYIAASIKDLIQKGYRYGDISVVCRNSEKYTDLMENTFKKWEIPSFISRPYNAESSPLIRLLTSVFEICEKGFKTEEIFNILKTGLISVQEELVFELENYVYMWKIDGASWKNPFTKSVHGFEREDDEEETEKLEKIRKMLVGNILKFKKTCEKASGAEISEAVYNLFLDLNVQENLIIYTENLERLNLTEKSKEQIRVWDKLMDLLDKFADIIGQRAISLSDYQRYLRKILSKEDLMDIPLRLDNVMFGTADNIKHSSKIVFLVGCILGDFPRIPSEKGIFTSAERRFLKEKQVELQFDTEMEMLLERFYAYSACFSATEKVFLSYYTSDGTNEFIKSEIMDEVQRVSGAEIKKELPFDYYCTCEEALFALCAQKYRENSPESESLKEVTQSLFNLETRFEALKRAVSDSEFKLDKNSAKTLFGSTTFSPSQIENYHQCKFWYFCRYGLGAKSKKTAEVDVLRYGTLMHYVFEQIIATNSYENMEETEIEKYVSDLVKSYIEENMGGMDKLSFSDIYRIKRLEETAVLLSKRLIREMKQSKFKPKYLELKLEKDGEFPPLKIKTEDEREIFVRGIIDRVDIYEDNETKYVRIVDYKTGTKEFKLYDVLNGLSMQMLIYLAALSEKGLVPAGALYMPAAYPSVPAERGESIEKIRNKQDEKMCMSGIVLEDEDIITAMEKSVEGKFIPIKVKKNSEFTGSESLYLNHELTYLFSYVKKLISTMSIELLNGDIQAKPRVNYKNVCQWCEFKQICLKENSETEKNNLKKHEVMDLIRKEVMLDEKVDG